MWAHQTRNFDHCNQETNAAIEGWHSSMKAILKRYRKMLRGRRLDWLLWVLAYIIVPRYQDSRIVKDFGFQRNVRGEAMIFKAIQKVCFCLSMCATADTAGATRLPADTGNTLLPATDMLRPCPGGPAVVSPGCTLAA